MSLRRQASAPTAAPSDRLQAVLRTGLQQQSSVPSLSNLVVDDSNSSTGAQDKANPSKRTPGWSFGGGKKTKEADKRIAELRKQAEECQNKEVDMNKRVVEATKKFTEAQEHIEALNIERLQLKEQLSEARERTNEASRAAMAKLKDANLSEAELAEVRVQLNAAAQQYSNALETLQQQGKQIQVDRTVYGEQIEALQAANSRLQKERDDFNGANASLRDQLKALEDALAAGDADDGADGADDEALRGIKAAYDRVAEANDRFFEEAEQLQQQASDVNVQVSMTVDVFDTLKASLDRLELQNAELKSLIETLQAQLSAATFEILEEIKAKTNELRLEDMEDLNTIIAMTNPMEFDQALRVAVGHNDVDKVRLLVKAGANPVSKTILTTSIGYRGAADTQIRSEGKWYNTAFAKAFRRADPIERNNRNEGLSMLNEMIQSLYSYTETPEKAKQKQIIAIIAEEGRKFPIIDESAGAFTKGLFDMFDIDLVLYGLEYGIFLREDLIGKNSGNDVPWKYPETTNTFTLLPGVIHAIHGHEEALDELPWYEANKQNSWYKDSPYHIPKWKLANHNLPPLKVLCKELLKMGLREDGLIEYYRDMSQKSFLERRSYTTPHPSRIDFQGNAAKKVVAFYDASI